MGKQESHEHEYFWDAQLYTPEQNEYIWRETVRMERKTGGNLALNSWEWNELAEDIIARRPAFIPHKELTR